MPTGWPIPVCLPDWLVEPISIGLPAPLNVGEKALNSKSEQVIWAALRWASAPPPTRYCALAFRFSIRNGGRLAPRTAEVPSSPSTHWPQRVLTHRAPLHWMMIPGQVTPPTPSKGWIPKGSCSPHSGIDSLVDRASESPFGGFPTGKWASQ